MKTPSLVTLGWATALLASAAMPLQARAQDEQPAGPLLRVRFTDGKSVHLRESRRVEEIVDYGMIPMVKETVLVRDMTLRPLGRTDAGDWEVEWTFDRVLGSIKSPLASETFDSKKKRADEANLLIEPLVAIAGTSFTVTISPRGEVMQVAGVAQALKQATARYGDEADMYQMVLREAFSAARMQQELQLVLVGAPLPEKAITADGSWSVARSVAGPTGVTWTFTQQVKPNGGYNDIAEFEAAGEGGAKVNARRATSAGLLLSDGSPDDYFVSSSYAIAKSDGLPLGCFTSFWVTASGEDEDGSTSTYRQRAQFEVQRIFDEELRGVRNSDTIPRVVLIKSWHPKCYVERLRWARAKGQLYAGSEEPDEARATFTAARALAAELVEGGSVYDDIAETDGKPRDWLVWWTTLSNDLARVEFGAENWDAAVRVWGAVLESEPVRKAAAEGDGQFVWRRVRADVMVGRSLAAKGDAGKAMEHFAAAEAEMAARRRAAPDNRGLDGPYAWVLDRWSAALQEAGQAAEALEKGVAALAIRDGMAATEPRQPGDQRSLVDTLWELGDLALAAGDAKRAAAFLDRGQTEVQALFEYGERFEAYHADLVQRRDDCLLIAGGGKAADAAQSIRLAYLLNAMKRHADAHVQFELAFADPTIRDDWGDHNLYNAACNAALAHAAAADADRAAYAAAAVAWLKPHVERLNGFLNDEDEASRAPAASYLKWTREGDPDLQLLRALPEFKALFE